MMIIVNFKTVIAICLLSFFLVQNVLEVLDKNWEKDFISFRCSNTYFLPKINNFEKHCLFERKPSNCS
jgi:hypothetical protein